MKTLYNKKKELKSKRILLKSVKFEKHPTTPPIRQGTGATLGYHIFFFIRPMQVTLAALLSNL